MCLISMYDHCRFFSLHIERINLRQAQRIQLTLDVHKKK